MACHSEDEPDPLRAEEATHHWDTSLALGTAADTEIDVDESRRLHRGCGSSRNSLGRGTSKGSRDGHSLATPPSEWTWPSRMTWCCPPPVRCRCYHRGSPACPLLVSAPWVTARLSCVRCRTQVAS